LRFKINALNTQMCTHSLRPHITCRRCSATVSVRRRLIRSRAGGACA
jgi:hypothetical protein